MHKAMTKTFKCARCGLEFKSSWSDEEATAESEMYFGKIAEEDKAVVCDPCYQIIHPAKFPGRVVAAKREAERGR